jgi:catechol 2,3-dioxygenase-like lactoylglutathione lyase family enzyme
VITGINHLTLSVRNLEQSLAFYIGVLGFQPVARWPTGAYLLAGDFWVCLVFDEDTRVTALPEYTHVAFTVAPHDFDALSDRIRAASAPIWQENRTEGASLYFLDPNGHKLKIHASDLESRLRAAKQTPREELEILT